jgi:phosphonatase-like hydrolase
MIKMVVFDMAGTTIDEDNMVYKCVTKAFIDHKISVDLDTVLLHGAGKEKLDAIKSVYTEVLNEIPDEATAQEIYLSFKALLEEAYSTIQMKLFDGVKALLYFLHKRDIKVVFNTGYTHAVASDILKKVNIIPGRDIDLLVTADMVAHSRPAPDMIHYALHQYQIRPWECIKVGDSVVDIEEGKNAKVKYSIGITTGAQSAAILSTATPDYIIHHLRDLIEIIDFVNNTL